MEKETGLVALKCEATISICKSKLFKGFKDSYSINGGCVNGGSGHIMNFLFRSWSNQTIGIDCEWATKGETLSWVTCRWEIQHVIRSMVDHRLGPKWTRFDQI